MDDQTEEIPKRLPAIQRLKEFRVPLTLAAIIVATTWILGGKTELIGVSIGIGSIAILLIIIVGGETFLKSLPETASRRTRGALLMIMRATLGAWALLTIVGLWDEIAPFAYAAAGLAIIGYSVKALTDRW